MPHELFLKKEDVVRWISNSKTKSNGVKKRKIRFADLFSGCGGLSHGIEQAALKNGIDSICVLAVESDLAPLAVYKENIKHKKGAVLNTDILNILSIASRKKLTKDEMSLKKKVGGLDILVAGPPCQGHSNLNNSTRRNDPRNNLYLACIRAVELFEPKLVIIENVPSVIHSVEGVVQTTEDRLIQIGYKVRHLNINFLDLGIPQTRKRHILIASKDNNFCDLLTPLTARRQNPTLKDFIYKIKQAKGLLAQSGKLSKNNIDRVEYLFENVLFDLPDQCRPLCHRENSHSYKSMYGRLRWDLPAQTLTSGYGSMGQGRYIHPSERRTLNSREAARIQGFPDFYSFSQVSKITDLRKMIANAVPPQLTYIISNLYFKNVIRRNPKSLKNSGII